MIPQAGSARDEDGDGDDDEGGDGDGDDDGDGDGIDDDDGDGDGDDELKGDGRDVAPCSLINCNKSDTLKCPPAESPPTAMREGHTLTSSTSQR